jgi:hypothetical protein
MTHVAMRRHECHLANGLKVAALLFHLFCGLCQPVSSGTPCDTACQQEQREGLVELYGALNGPSWRLQTGWLSLESHCEWAGLSCCPNHHVSESPTSVGPPYFNEQACASPGAVISLVIPSNNASGTIPDKALKKLLLGLAFLDLRNNDLHGTLPTVLSTSRQLQWLLADGNNFSGTLPQSSRVELQTSPQELSYMTSLIRQVRTYEHPSAALVVCTTSEHVPAALS